MNIFFVFPSIKLDLTVNHGIASLCGVIRDKGHKVFLYHPDRLNDRELTSEFRKEDYDLCLVSSVTNQWPYALQMIRSLRRISDIPVIAGGHHVTHYPNILEEHDDLDGICIGEGDIALGELLDKLEKGEDYHHINNMRFRRRKDGKLINSGIGGLIEDLDSLPPPDYSVFSGKNISNYPALMFSRGCPYSCTYCCNNSLKKLYKGKGKYMRTKSVTTAIKETAEFIRTYDPPALNFDDDTFIKNREWLYSFLDEYRKITTIPFNCNTRPETVDEDLCKRLAAANCNIISIGVESGNEELRKKILKRHMSNAMIERSFELIKNSGIKTSSFNMVGIPDETYEDYMDTVKLNRRIDPDFMQISIFYPYKETELGDYARAQGYVRSDGNFSHSYFSRSILSMERFPKWKIKCAYLFFHFNVIRRRSPGKAVYYLLRYNVLKNAFLKKSIRTVINIFRQ